ncbi:hypothetical protein FJTKL_00945 [Diaporthe vaccinii]|uniref:Protein kinase domain-containing protein n=1 Tax=Diaporthe vaccinii TaxID=105482 RepID=A0ABR4E1Q0_9PEZI
MSQIKPCCHTCANSCRRGGGITRKRRHEAKPSCNKRPPKVNESTPFQPSATTTTTAKHPEAAREPSSSSSSQSRPPSPARVFPSSGSYQIAKSRLVDEENYSWYSPIEFFPIRIGELIRDRYQVITKLGYGTSSTSWLCRDLRGH